MTQRSRKAFLWVIVLVILLAAALFAGRRWIFTGGEPDLPVLAAVPGFDLVDQNGRSLSNKDLLGKSWIADFIFTRCAGPCPVMTETMSGLQDEIPADVAFVSFSLDPGYDTPERLKEYARKYGADPERWIFLTGDREAIHSIPRSLKLILDTDGDPIIHSSRYLLVDPEGQIRGWYTIVGADLEADETELARMRQDVEILLGSAGG
jgi:cytochrome oxidase Cu insertion factor (SCO1/SenC/PrrC family)